MSRKAARPRSAPVHGIEGAKLACGAAPDGAERTRIYTQVTCEACRKKLFGRYA